MAVPYGLLIGSALEGVSVGRERARQALQMALKSRQEQLRDQREAEAMMAEARRKDEALGLQREELGFQRQHAGDVLSAQARESEAERKARAEAQGMEWGARERMSAAELAAQERGRQETLAAQVAREEAARAAERERDVFRGQQELELRRTLGKEGWAPSYPAAPADDGTLGGNPAELEAMAQELERQAAAAEQQVFTKFAGIGYDETQALDAVARSPEAKELRAQAAAIRSRLAGVQEPAPQQPLSPGDLAAQFLAERLGLPWKKETISPEVESLRSVGGLFYRGPSYENLPPEVQEAAILLRKKLGIAPQEALLAARDAYRALVTEPPLSDIQISPLRR